jgi:hypothetical protein
MWRKSALSTVQSAFTITTNLYTYSYSYKTKMQARCACRAFVLQIGKGIEAAGLDARTVSDVHGQPMRA